MAAVAVAGCLQNELKAFDAANEAGTRKRITDGLLNRGYLKQLSHLILPTLGC